jgi:PAS domain S-box-containing protein
MHPSSPSPALTLDLLVSSVVDYAIFMLDPTGVIISWNAGAERIKGWRAEEIIGRHFSAFYPPEDVAARKPDRELEIAAADGRLEDEGWRVRADGSRFWANVVITALYDDTGQLRGFGKVTRDLTERRAAEQALTVRRQLLTHLVEAQEHERRRIAWDVHDESIQSMVAVGMRLQLLAGRLSGRDAEEAVRIDDAVRTSIARLRALTLRLRPPGVDRNGLADTLSGYLGEVVADWGLTTSLRYGTVRDLPPETAITAFRICQEALINVHKHAHASTVEVAVTEQDLGLRVQVSDDGVGVGDPATRLTEPGHFGLVEMRERAEIAGGWWTMHPRAGGGTTVDFWLPLAVDGEVGA